MDGPTYAATWIRFKTWLIFRVIFVPKMSSAIFTQVPCMNIKLIIQNIYEINLHDPRIVD